MKWARLIGSSTGWIDWRIRSRERGHVEQSSGHWRPGPGWCPVGADLWIEWFSAEESNHEGPSSVGRQTSIDFCDFHYFSCFARGVIKGHQRALMENITHSCLSVTMHWRDASPRPWQRVPALPPPPSQTQQTAAAVLPRRTRVWCVQKNALDCQPGRRAAE